MYPNQPPSQYPPAPPQQYAPPMPQYPPQPPAPAYPQQYPPQQYAQPQYPMAPAGPPPAPGTLDGFYEQPSSGGGPSWKFNGKPIGTQYAGIVARTVTNADVRHQTDQAQRPVTYRDGRPKLVMVVPMQVQPSPEFPEGVAGWWVKGQARDELARAMAEAGAPAGPPEAGAVIRVTLVGQRPVPNMNPAYQYRVEYVRPNGAAPVQLPQVAQPAPVQQQYAPQAVPLAQPVQMPVPVQQPMPMPMPAPAQVAPQPVVAAPQGAVPAGFSEEQAALFAKLTGG